MRQRLQEKEGRDDIFGKGIDDLEIFGALIRQAFEPDLRFSVKSVLILWCVCQEMYHWPYASNKAARLYPRPKVARLIRESRGEGPLGCRKLEGDLGDWLHSRPRQHLLRMMERNGISISVF